MISNDQSLDDREEHGAGDDERVAAVAGARVASRAAHATEAALTVMLGAASTRTVR